MSENTATEETSFVERLLASMRLEALRGQEMVPVRGSLQDLMSADETSAEARFITGLAALLHNVDGQTGRFDKGEVLATIDKIDEFIDAQLNEVLHHPDFQKMEANWRGLEDLVMNTNFRANIVIDVLDVGKQELDEDFENNSASIFGSTLFQKVYVSEYDQYGGRPFGAMIGLFEFENTPRDIYWLRSMGKLANASHVPFISSVSAKFFGCQTIEEVEAIKDLEGLLSQPKYSSWSAFRDSEEAAYVGLCFPRYIVRLPWGPEKNPCRQLSFNEEANGRSEHYVWGNAALLMARNLVRSFERTGWCQNIRGPKGGGLIAGLTVDTFELRGEQEIMPPVELAIPDYRELEFARAGFIPLIHRKGTGDATFFSAQAVKRSKGFKDPNDMQNAQLVCNLAYTFSITRIAHYIKCIMRDNIGSSADRTSTQRIIESWLMGYVTDVTSPDELTLKYYPFKAASVTVTARPAELGWYDCAISILPHIQFEGMSVELRLESRLGSST